MTSARTLFTRTGGGNVGRSMLVATMSAAAIATSVTGALFTDSDASTGNQFTTGTVDLALNSTTAIVADTADMAPGDVATGSVTVTNNGSLEQRYALKSVTTEDLLAAQLDLTIWAEAAEATTSDGVCGAIAPTTVLYGTGPLGSTGTGVNLIGNPASGPQGGERTLAAAASDMLCFRVELPVGSDNTFQNETTTATFTFDAEQTVNNA